MIQTLLLFVLGFFVLASPVFASSVVINEFMANPPTGANEWVELYNPTGNTISLTGWVLLDGSNSTKSLNNLGTITAGGYVVYEYPSGDGWLNNTATSTNPETITLRDNTGAIVDSFSYTVNQSDSITTGRSPDEGNWTILTSVSRGSTNGSSTPDPIPTSTPTPTPTTTTSSSTSAFIISNIPSPVDSTEEFRVSVNLSLSDKPNTTFYLKGAFKKQGQTNYFGMTKVGNSWIKNSTKYEDQYKIITDGSGNWSGNLEIMPDILDSGYEGAGDYLFKVARYTESGSLTWSNETKITINAQAVTLEDDNSNVLGTARTQAENDKSPSFRKQNEEYSLEKYLKLATPASEAAGETIAQATVNNKKQINSPLIIGIILIVSGIGLSSYIYLQSHETIFNKFRKRNQRLG